MHGCYTICSTTYSHYMSRHPLDFYLGLKYPVVIHPANEGGYVAEIQELEGCMTQGETAQEIMEAIDEARILWLETAYEAGQEIPLPKGEVKYSGKTMVRMPRSLHRKLAQGAEREGVSLNQFIVVLLSSSVSTYHSK